jgi:serine carboxypeptidase-like clade 1
MNTANDNFNALLNFFELYPEYWKNPFWIAGESYAGKYIPDLTVLIDSYNIQAKNIINLKGFLIGNGVMDFTNGAI